MSGIQGWCEADRCEGECAGCGNAAGLRWFCGNPEDALTADQWVEVGVHSTGSTISWNGPDRTGPNSHTILRNGPDELDIT